MLDGGTDIDTADYSGEVAGGTINLLTSSAVFASGTDTLISIENVIGSGFFDTINGNTLNNDLIGGAGNDTISGSGGNDLLDGGTGGDRLLGGSGDDDLIGGVGNDLLAGNSDNDVLDGVASQDTLIGGNGDDTLEGGFGNDVLNGGDDIDTGVYSGFGGGITVNLNISTVQNTGAAGNDVIVYVENLIGGQFNDRLTGKPGVSVLDGGDGSDKLFGLGGNDTLNGGGGNDNIQGGAFHDHLTGGLGRDIMVGGTGFDVFDFNDIAESAVGGQRDRINDFTQGIDTIDLGDIDAISGGGDNAFNFIGQTAFTGTAGQLNYRFAPSRTVVEGDVDGDGNADFSIELFVTVNLVAGDFDL